MFVYSVKTSKAKIISLVAALAAVIIAIFAVMSKSEKPAAMNVDGECDYVTECTFEIVEKGINFVVPACSDFLERVKNNNV